MAHALNSARNLGTPSNLDVVMCGSMTPVQNTIMCNKKELGTGFYLNLLCWSKAHYAGCRGKELECPLVPLVEDTESPHSTDEKGDTVIEPHREEGVFYFTSGNDSKEESIIHTTTWELAMVLLENKTAPVLVVQGGGDMQGTRSPVTLKM